MTSESFDLENVQYDAPPPDLPRHGRSRVSSYQWLTEILDKAVKSVEVPVTLPRKEAERRSFKGKIYAAARREAIRRGVPVRARFFGKPNSYKAVLVLTKGVPTDTDVDGDQSSDPIAQELSEVQDEQTIQNDAVEAEFGVERAMSPEEERAYNQGYEAASVHRGLDSNPYNSGTVEARAFVRGHKTYTDGVEAAVEGLDALGEEQ